MVLTYDAAKAAGLPLEMLNYGTSVDTANGRTRAASGHASTASRRRLRSWRRSVPALIAQPGQLRTSLLGMSFLTAAGDAGKCAATRLVLRGYK